MAQNGFSSLGALFAGVGGGNPYLPGAREKVLKNMLLSQHFQLGNQEIAANQAKAQARQGFEAHFQSAHPNLPPAIAQYIGNAEAAGYNPEQIAQALAARQTQQMQLANWEAAQNTNVPLPVLNRMSIGAHPGSTYRPIRNEGGTILNTGADSPSLSGAMSAPVEKGSHPYNLKEIADKQGKLWWIDPRNPHRTAIPVMKVGPDGNPVQAHAAPPASAQALMSLLGMDGGGSNTGGAPPDGTIVERNGQKFMVVNGQLHPYGG